MPTRFTDANKLQLFGSFPNMSLVSSRECPPTLRETSLADIVAAFPFLPFHCAPGLDVQISHRISCAEIEQNNPTAYASFILVPL